jgi:hypothetical protein
MQEMGVKTQKWQFLIVDFILSEPGEYTLILKQWLLGG